MLLLTVEGERLMRNTVGSHCRLVLEDVRLQEIFVQVRQ